MIVFSLKATPKSGGMGRFFWGREFIEVDPEGNSHLEDKEPLRPWRRQRSSQEEEEKQMAGLKGKEGEPFKGEPS